MTHGVKTILIPVRDRESAVALYTELLGVEPSVNESYYVHFEAGGVQIGLLPHGHAQGETGPVTYWGVDDIAKSRDALVAAGATVREDVKDVGGGRQVATLADADGNVIGLTQD